MVGEFYAEYDEPSGLYCVYHSEISTAIFSYSSQEEADAMAYKLNRGIIEGTWNDYTI